MAPNDKMTIAGNPMLFESRVNENEDQSSSANTQDLNLLKALQDLIIRVMDPRQTSDINQIYSGPEAGELITALQAFISSIAVRSQSRPRNIIEVRLDDEEDQLQLDDHDDDEEGKPLSKISLLASNIDARVDGSTQYPEKPQPTFEEKMLGALREHVFNTMPIRLLCFEPYGSRFQISLLEQDAVFARLALTLQKNSHDDAFRPRMIKWTNGFAMETDQHVIKRLITRYAKYAILSHTWLRTTTTGSEVTYADWNQGFLDSKGPGYLKLVKFCKTAWKHHQLTFGWMDTVCINKDSSSELDESIRSMYNWYSRASVCITYLAETETLSNMHLDPWFTRGWTFQELLAPRMLKFYNSRWKRLIDNPYCTDKNATEITEQIERATTMSKDELTDIHQASISRTMQLTAAREVTREEDMAYSLMGIFNVSMSIAYGEGAPRAFSRLLQEILLSSEDVLDILNWSGELPDTSSRPYNSRILPSSPKNYINRSSNKSLILRMWPIEPLTLSHRGLRVPVILMPGLSVQDIASQHNFVGDYYATANISPLEHHKHSVSTSYHLLDNRASGEDGWKEKNTSHQMTFAVFNFTAAPIRDVIRLPKTCIAIGLWCHEPTGKVSPMGGAGFVRTNEPIVFELNKRTPVDENSYGSDKGYWHVKSDELAIHGMQLISLYL